MPAAKEATDEASLRAKALAAIDAGDLDAADTPLRSIVRQHPDAIGSRGLLDAVAAITGRDAVHSYVLVQQPLTKVDALPAPVAANAKPQKLAVETSKTERRFGGEVGIGDPQRFGLPNEFQRDPYVRVPAMIPRSDGGLRLVMTRFSGGRWLAFYGHDNDEIRIGAIIGGDGKLEAHLDFSAWRENGQESGIGAAELYEDTLYVESRARSIVAVELKTGKVRWRSESGYANYAFFAGPTQIATWTYDGITVLDRKTGAVVATANTNSKSISKIEPKNGFVEAIAYPQELLRVKADVKAPGPLKLTELPEGTSKIASDELEPADEAQRAKAYEALELGAPIEAVSLLRPVLDRHPQNLAAAALLRAARNDLAEARDKAREVVEKETAKIVSSDHLGGRASKMPAPHVNVKEEPETRPFEAWLASAKGTATLEVDVSPSSIPISVAPGWLPDRIKERTRGVTNVRGTRVVAVYGVDVVATFDNGRLVSYIRFDATSDVRYVMGADWAGDDIVVLVEASERQLVGVDAKTGAMSWRTSIDAVSFVVDRGAVVCSINGASERGAPAVAVLDAQSGKFLGQTPVSRGFQLYGGGPSVVGWSPGTRLVIDLS